MYEYWAESQAAVQSAYERPYPWPPHHPKPQPHRHCPQLPGTVLRVSIPPGAVINLANLLEVTSPSGICLIVRVPIFGKGMKLNSIIQAIEQAGGTVEFE